MRRDQGQAAVELALWTPWLLAAALVAVQLLLYLRAQERAELLADQAAALVAEGRPLPASLRRAATIEVAGRRVSVAVAVPGLPLLRGSLQARAQARLP